jgi:hypothetical protein
MKKAVKKSFERMQKVAVLALCVVLAGCFYSCTNRAEAGGNVPFKPCPCEEEKPMFGPFQGEAYLFRDFIPEEMLHQISKENSDDPSRGVRWIVFNSETGRAELTVARSTMLGISEICNFPTFALEWNIPKNGCKVYLEGISYESCVPKGGIAMVTYSDLILTNLIRK